ncbi:MAG: hypothetical protein H8E19_17390 [Deltaproteobacteria bacterium]|uniref:Uncharacterized protein n=1 Tax=Candidatus Desulfacyla euxinica TaxID=2841693 RepID=A0A8J6N3A3_9DELT|nr:hypothetical protein [Candidatus Desulfacyla euxinica]MBL7218397.1 hypothetical protein [Desulfobacteraceae bacterium]
MKKIIVLLAAVLLLPGIALAESVNVFDAGGGNKLIYRTTDDGDVQSSLAIETAGGYVVTDQNGNSTLVNDFSRDDQWGDRKDRD